MDWLFEEGKKKTLESGWPAHCRGFYIKGYLKKNKIQEGFCGETHTRAFWTKDSCWLKRGETSMGGALDLHSFASYQKTFAGTLRRPHTAVFTTSKPRVLHEWTVRAEVTLYDPQKSEFSLMFRSVWWRDRRQRDGEGLLECVGMVEY